MNELDDAKLFDSLIYLADTLVEGFAAIDVADRLVGTRAALLDIRAAGILLDDQQGQLRLLASSDEEMRLLELIQLQANEGPCLDALSSGELVAVPDLAQEQARWPRFAPQAVDDGVLGVYALPLRLRERTIGALNLFRAEVGELPPVSCRSPRCSPAWPPSASPTSAPCGVSSCWPSSCSSP